MKESIYGATGVPTATAVSATFNKEMNASTINTASFLLASAESAVSGTVSYDASSRTATFLPQEGLSLNVTYIATVTAAVKDTEENTMTAPYVWSFTTGQTAAPAFYPAAGTYEAAQTIVLSCGTASSDIYYTLDGSVPTVSSTKYINPIQLTSSETVKALAVKSGMMDSMVAAARYDIYSWQALGSGMDNAVTALALDTSGILYAGGSFSTAGGIPANRVAKWNSSSWSAMGIGIDSSVMALTINASGEVCAGGLFITAGGRIVNYVSKWGK